MDVLESQLDPGSTTTVLLRATYYAIRIGQPTCSYGYSTRPHSQRPEAGSRPTEEACSGWHYIHQANLTLTRRQAAW